MFEARTQTMKARGARSALLLACLFVLPAGAAAQPGAADPGATIPPSVSTGAEQGAPRESLELTLEQAEKDSLKSSDRLKAFGKYAEAAQEQAGASYATLWPRLSFDAYYRRQSEVPTITVNGTELDFGSHDNYNYGPTLKYTLWDTFASRKTYSGNQRLAESRDDERKNAAVQELLATRGDYVAVQELNDELKSTYDSLLLARSHLNDITTNLRAGAATKLDKAEAEREVLSLEIQYAETQSELASAVKNLLARTRDASFKDLSRPGPPGLPNLTLELRIDALDRAAANPAGPDIPAPDDGHPRLRSQELKAQSLSLQAESVKAGLFPTVEAFARAALEYPSVGPVIEQINQNVIGVKATMPIFEMGQTRHLAKQKRLESDTARSELDQSRRDLQRDFDKAKELLASLREQQSLAQKDVQNSAEVAVLYYEHYKGGKANLIDVQTADNRALASRVNKSRIDAQVLNQLYLLKALSGKEIPE